MRKENIVIFRDRLLGYSETFIKTQAMALKNYTPFFAGSKNVRQLDLSGLPLITIESLYGFPRIKEILFKTRSSIPIRLLSEIEKISPKLIHAHFGPDGYLILPIARELNLPLVTTFHGYDVSLSDSYTNKTFFLHRRFLKNRSVLIAKGTCFIAVSNFIKQKLIEKGFPEDKIKVHYVGVDTGYFVADQTKERQDVILFVGRLVEIKGCQYLIDAMEIVQKEKPGALLYIVGQGPLETDLKRRAAQQEVRAKFFGSLSHSEVKDLMGIAKVLCVPSVRLDNGCEEGLGLTFLEAQSMGLPVVSCKTGGIPEAVIENKTGLLSKERDIRALSYNILELLSNREKWEAFSNNGKKHVREKFTMLNQTAKLEEIYSSLDGAGV